MKKFKKNLVLFFIFTLFFSSTVSPTKLAYAFDHSSAKTYLESHGTSPWATIALGVLQSNTISTDHLKNLSGSSAIELEAPILALTSLELNPKTFSSIDYVAKLKSFFVSNQIGDASTLNDDIFGILALVSSGEPLSDSVILGTKNFLLSKQNSDGGWGFTTTSESDSNTTASAITALIASGSNASDQPLQKALTYLLGAQNSDGGFTYDPFSSYGTESDSSSTAWAIWALQAMGINPLTITKGGNNPIAYLASNQTQSGFFKYQANSSEDSFSPITTSYSVIALSGKTLPIKVLSSTQPIESFNFRIEGSQNTVCSGKVAGPTAIDIVKNASIMCGFTYNIDQLSFGPYLNKINNDTASGSSGWLYFVNNISPEVGASEYKLKSNDEVLWYFGDFGWTPTRLKLSKTQVSSGQSAEATVESFSNGVWSPLPSATLSIGLSSTQTDNSGKASVNNSDGFYQIFATKNGYVRSNKILLQIGQPNSSGVSLIANVGGGIVNGTSTQGSGIAFTVNPTNLDFGSLNPGQNSTKKITISNTGNSDILVESVVSGDEIFTNGLNINGYPWQLFTQSLIKSENKEQNVKLTIPQSYSGSSGQKNGQIIFWARVNN